MKLRLSATVRILSVPVVAIAVLFLSACSNGALQQAGSTLPTATVPAALSDSGNSAGVRRDTISTHELFVGEFGFKANYVAIYQNGTFKKIGKIKLGINHPYGAWADSYGLYIANDFAPSITEYSSPSSKPFTYNAGMSSPVAVTTDPLGNVFEGDLSGYVNEYQQKINFVSTKCSLGGSVTGVATDGPNVFVGYLAFPVAYIFEFTDFSGCSGHLLGVRLKGGPDLPAGMAIDKNHHIIICEPGNQTVDIIKPPYKAVSSYLSVSYPTDVTINSANNRMWIASPFGVVDLYYPSGKIVGSIPGPDAVSAVDGSNYVH